MEKEVYVINKEYIDVGGSGLDRMENGVLYI